MSAPHPAPDASQPSVEHAARVERCMAMLEGAAAKGLALMAAVKEDGSKESAEAYAKVSRAFRLTIDRVIKPDSGPRVRTARAVAQARNPATDVSPEAPDPYAPLRTGKKARVRELVRDVIERETPDVEEADTLGDALDERLLCDRAYADVEHLPLRDIVEHLCADLELKPKWYRWIDEKEGWKPNPPFYRPLCSEFRTPSRRPILNDAPDPHLLE